MDSTYKLDISMYDENFVLKMIERRCLEAGGKTAPEYTRFLSGSSTEANELYRSLNISYSSFFRNPLAFTLLEQWIIPALINGKPAGSEIRVWSAGCSCGQEAYSVAILLDKLLSIRPDAPRFRIFATDISETALSSGREGRYDEESMQNVPLKYLRGYFNRCGDAYEIAPRLKQHVDFSVHDLLDTHSSSPQESIFGDFDIVFCSNLLIYYRPAHQQIILKKILRALSACGYLVTGEAEKGLVEKAGGLRLAAPPAAVFGKK